MNKLILIIVFLGIGGGLFWIYLSDETESKKEANLTEPEASQTDVQKINTEKKPQESQVPKEYRVINYEVKPSTTFEQKTLSEKIKNLLERNGLVNLTEDEINRLEDKVNILLSKQLTLDIIQNTLEFIDDHQLQGETMQKFIASKYPDLEVQETFSSLVNMLRAKKSSE